MRRPQHRCPSPFLVARCRPRIDTQNPSTRTILHAEFGELSISPPPFLEPDLIQAATEPLPWESSSNPTQPADDWQTGQLWFETRSALMKLWVLPRDMSNGSWEPYAMAANRGEMTLLTQVPQLLRLSHVTAAAQYVLHDLGLPAAVLRQEPLLLVMTVEQLQGGFDTLVAKEQQRQGASDDHKECSVKSTRAAIRDTPNLFTEAAKTWAVSP